MKVIEAAKVSAALRATKFTPLSESSKSFNEPPEVSPLPTDRLAGAVEAPSRISV